MRGRVEGAIENPLTELGQWSYVLTGGLYLATASAFLLLNSRLKTSIKVKVLCWPVLGLCSVLGFLSGSRAIFLYSFAPLALSAWLQLIRLRLGKGFRLIVVCGVVVVLASAWVAMTAIRGQDVRNYEGTWEDIRPGEYARGAFDIYSSSALIVQSFPQQFDYEYGRSLVPLLLGWVPRSVWPEKPYPFSIYANTIRGETLGDRSASIAVGLSGEGYGNFGLFGVLLWGTLMGLACRGADSYLKRFHPSNSLRLFLGASISIWAAMIVRGGVAEMFYMGLQVNMFPIALSLVLKLFAPKTSSAYRQSAPLGSDVAVNA
jgi:oligosaccharide repeat unit polymerase